MFISPNIAIEEGWVTGIANPELQVQPNAIDFTLDQLYKIRTSAPFIISERGKHMRGVDVVNATVNRRLRAIFDEDIMEWELKGSTSVYDGMSDVYVELPEGVAAMTIIRSSFNRNGVFITSGLYDSGFKGHIGFAIHDRLPGVTRIAVGTRIGQIMFIQSDKAGLYAGGYNHEANTHYTNAGNVSLNIDIVDPVVEVVGAGESDQRVNGNGPRINLPVVKGE